MRFLPIQSPHLRPNPQARSSVVDPSVPGNQSSKLYVDSFGARRFPPKGLDLATCRARIELNWLTIRWAANRCSELDALVVEPVTEIYQYETRSGLDSRGSAFRGAKIQRQSRLRHPVAGSSIKRPLWSRGLLTESVFQNARSSLLGAAITLFDFGPCKTSQTRALSNDSGDPRHSSTSLARPRTGTNYWASDNIPPANECHTKVVLIGQFSSFTAISAAPP